MSNIVKFSEVESKVITLRDKKVILDSDVAVLYGVEVKRVNEAVKNNPDKFPDGYVFELYNAEKEEVVENFDHLSKLKFSSTLPKAFTEKGLYMLATILKSPQATETTIAIVEAFEKIRELQRTMLELSESQEESLQKTLMQKSGDIISELLGSDMQATDSETSIELNLALLKFKHTVKRKK
ncbi:hypothetical protein FACS189430_05250 [Bacteroidia bacterium]|nr:hypothetical protein FACS189430_05250 [Bacteroidia bacterium]